MIKQIVKLAKRNESMTFTIRARQNGQWLEITKDKIELSIGKDVYVVCKNGVPIYSARTAQLRNEILQMPLGRTPDVETLNVDFTNEEWNAIYGGVFIYCENILNDDI